MLRDEVLGKVGGAAGAGGKEAGGAGGAPTVDLSVECAGMLVALHLAQAQECFFDTAASTGKSPAVCVKLAKQAHNFYEEVKAALAAPPLKDHFDKSWSAHATAKGAAFHAEALQRAAKVAEEEEDIGGAIARLQVAAKVLHDAVKAGGSFRTTTRHTLNRRSESARLCEHSPRGQVMRARLIWVRVLVLADPPARRSRAPAA